MDKEIESMGIRIRDPMKKKIGCMGIIKIIVVRFELHGAQRK